MSDSIVDVPVIMVLLLIVAAPAIILFLALHYAHKGAKGSVNYAKEHPEVVVAGIGAAAKAAPLVFA